MSLPELQLLAWDSEFLGFVVARAVVPPQGAAALSALVAQARGQGVRLLYLIIDPAADEAAANARATGAWLADRKVTFSRPIGPEPGRLADPGPVIPLSTFSPELEALAWQSGEYSRFRRDPAFAPGVFERLYSQWLRASLRGELARAVLAWPGPDGKPTGLLTLQSHGPQASIGLLAVQAGQRSQGQGRALVAAASRTAQAWGYQQLRVVTQLDNIPACRFYTSVGFVIEHQENVYHLWL
ncbi:GNAT family N-acetyltransferase [Hymenobacter sp. UYCo722]|uniref:GNAT family N-acetyltransferase n=1 Tax=Hymenobacter sp. UYCo722 TaxID=3156335 RepID=UPI003398E4D0